MVIDLSSQGLSWIFRAILKEEEILPLIRLTPLIDFLLLQMWTLFL